MTERLTTSSDSVRCAAWARSSGVDPIATIGFQVGFLLVEWPLPWPRDIREVPELGSLGTALEGTGVRLQALVPQTADVALRRVVLYRLQNAAAFASYERAECVTPAEDLVAAVLDLIGTDEGETDSSMDSTTSDVLVCTHGRRDSCCGSQGTALIQRLSIDPTRLATVRVWRTSHIGGHRFAPTAVVLPQGTAWAFLDADALQRVIAQAGPLDDLLPRYRGCAGIESRGLQALERHAFAEIGWPWLQHRRRGEDLGDGRVRLHAESPAGMSRAWEATVVEGRQLAVPDCGQPIELAMKVETELIVRDICRLA